jgi:hypothetical protein
MTTTTAPIVRELDTRDWFEAFAYAANETRAGGGDGASPQGTQGFKGSVAPFDREDVAKVIAMSDGENDDRPWVGVFLLKDGRYAYLEASCDYTGWDCHASGSSWVAASLPALVRWAVNEPARERLNLRIAR